MKDSSTDFIQNFDSSAYHIAIQPQDICEYILTVGDPNRIDFFLPHFDTLIKDVQKREFRTVIGHINQRRIMVISTGIGPDNIDIVFNEIRALHLMGIRQNLYPETPLKFIRIGTSGAIHSSIQVDDVVLSTSAVGLDNLPRFYHNDFSIKWLPALNRIDPYHVEGDSDLIDHFSSLGKKGQTLTCPGFYGPQARQTNLSSTLTLEIIKNHFSSLSIELTNLEMETAAIYYFSQQFNYKALSISAILADRLSDQFSLNPSSIVETVIAQTIQKLKTLLL